MRPLKQISQWPMAQCCATIAKIGSPAFMMLNQSTTFADNADDDRHLYLLQTLATTSFHSPLRCPLHEMILDSYELHLAQPHNNSCTTMHCWTHKSQSVTEPLSVSVCFIPAVRPTSSAQRAQISAKSDSATTTNTRNYILGCSGSPWGIVQRMSPKIFSFLHRPMMHTSVKYNSNLCITLCVITVTNKQTNKQWS